MVLTNRGASSAAYRTNQSSVPTASGAASSAVQKKLRHERLEFDKPELLDLTGFMVNRNPGRGLLA
ncbi:MAG: hypothetical protein RL326_1096 [Pseudomonadota bacterium]|jgi:hypothetical protein